MTQILVKLLVVRLKTFVMDLSMVGNMIEHAIHERSCLYEEIQVNYF